jgi:hypothetical protein
MDGANRLLSALVLATMVATGAAAANRRPATPREQKLSYRDENRAEVTLPSGTIVSVRIADNVNSSHNHSGDLITGVVDPSVLIGNQVVIPRGTEAHMRLMEDKKGGRLHGKASVRLELIALVMNKEKQDVSSDDYGKRQGALSAKAKSEANATASGGVRAAGSANPVVGAADPIIAIFRPAKVEFPAGTRISFTLTSSFTFEASHDTEESSTAR